MAQDKIEAPDISQYLFPMAGVMILVLAVMVGQAKSLFTNTSIEVDVPKANVVEADLEQMIPISVKKLPEGGVEYYYKDKKMSSLKEITDSVRAAQIRYGEENQDSSLIGQQLVVIRGDKSLNWGTILDVLDAVKRAKSKRVVLAVIKRRKAGG